MKFPVILRHSLTGELQDRWSEHYARASDRDRLVEEGIWRRTQEADNADESGWRSASDQRRRIIHYNHKFGLLREEKRSNLALLQAYIYYSLTLPKEDLAVDVERSISALELGGWKRVRQTERAQLWEIGDLACSMEFFDEHPEDLRAHRVLPAGYGSFDVVLGTKESIVDRSRLPWEVLANGMRIKDTRGRPTVISDLSALTKLLPFHVELGCGPSIEAGVPALHHLHDLYRVTEMKTGRFIFGGIEDDLITRLLLRPTTELAKLGRLYDAAFVAEPTLGHHALRALRDTGHLIGPIMTNNFDGLVHRVGLQEQFLRRYDETVPHVAFDPRAKSLLVIGSHADRRRVQARARAQGLQVIYLDPEGYTFDGHFIDYPLEGPCDSDLVCRMGATEGLDQLCAMLGLDP